MDKNGANRLLIYAIRTLQNRECVASPKGRIHIALLLKERLLENGFWWQARILNVWINRAIKGEFIATERAKRVRERRSGAERSGGAHHGY